MIVIVAIVLLLLSCYFVFSRKIKNSVVTAGGGRGAEKTEIADNESSGDTLLRERLCLPFREGSVTLALCDKMYANQYSACNTTLKSLEKVASLYLLVLCEEENHQSALLHEISSRLPDFRHVHRILFYSTAVGKIALVRQLKPSLHVEHDNNVCAKLAPHISKIAFIDVDGKGALDSMVINSSQKKGCVQRIDAIESLMTVSFASQ